MRFGITRDEDNVQVLAILAQRIFPTSIAAFYRFDKLVRETAEELLHFQRPGEAQADWRTTTVDKLVAGYHAHDFALTRRDLLGLGLNVCAAAPSLERSLWRFQEIFDTSLRKPGSFGETIGVVAAADFQVRHVLRRVPSPENAGANAGDDEGAAVAESLESVWVT